MANFDSQLTGAQIEAALTAVNGLISPANNGKILTVQNGLLVAKSAVEIQGGTIDAIAITENGLYTHAALGGYSPVTVNVPTGLITAKAIIKATYDEGYTCVCTNGTTSINSDTSGTYLFCLPSQGSWTLSCNGESTQVTVSEFGYITVDVSSVSKLRVGGKIFYIDSSASGATYKFYDQSENEIQSVQVGDAPYYYKVFGEKNKDKYYIVNGDVSGSKKWTHGTASEFFNGGTAIGAGKTTTAAVMEASSGAYAADTNSIWNYIYTKNQNQLGGCDDWYIPSYDELSTLWYARDSGGNKLVSWPYSEGTWTTSDTQGDYAWEAGTYFSSSSLSFSQNQKTRIEYNAVPVRSF